MPEHDGQRPRISTPGDLGRAIRARRKALGLTQEDVAAQVGVSRITVGAVENGKDTAHVGIVLQICRDLGLHLSLAEPPS